MRWLPLIVAVLCFGALLKFDRTVFAAVPSDQNWSLLYAAIFNWAAIQIGFLFGVYGFMVGSPTEFMKAIKNLKEFKTFRSGLVTSLFVGFLLAIVSLPLLVFTPDPANSSIILKIAIYSWFSCFVFAF